MSTDPVLTPPLPPEPELSSPLPPGCFIPSSAQRAFVDLALSTNSIDSISDMVHVGKISRATYYRWSRDVGFRAYFAMRWTERLVVDGWQLVNIARSNATTKFSYWKALYDLTFDPKNNGALQNWGARCVWSFPYVDTSIADGDDPEPEPQPPDNDPAGSLADYIAAADRTLKLFKTVSRQPADNLALSSSDETLSVQQQLCTPAAATRRLRRSLRIVSRLGRRASNSPHPRRLEMGAGPVVTEDGTAAARRIKRSLANRRS